MSWPTEIWPFFLIWGCLSGLGLILTSIHAGHVGGLCKDDWAAGVAISLLGPIGIAVAPLILTFWLVIGAVMGTAWVVKTIAVFVFGRALPRLGQALRRAELRKDIHAVEKPPEKAPYRDGRCPTCGK